MIYNNNTGEKGGDKVKEGYIVAAMKVEGEGVAVLGVEKGHDRVDRRAIEDAH